MRVYGLGEAVEAAHAGGVVTIGNFDGVHRGHVALLERCWGLARSAAAGKSCAVIAVTFEPHPVAVLRPGLAQRRLTTPGEKLRLLEAAGASAVVVLRTDQGLLRMSAEEFVVEALVKPLRPAVMVEGPGFGFGAGRRGDVETLRRMGAVHGFAVEVVAPWADEVGPGHQGAVISSSLIRQLLESGDVEAAGRALGRAYVLCGAVERGAGQGRGLGFATVNLNCGEQQIPGDGVYAGVATAGGRRFAAAISVGNRPTMQKPPPLPRADDAESERRTNHPLAEAMGHPATLDGALRVVEAHLIGDDAERYGEAVRLEFLRRLRDQRRFESAEALSRQIGEDVCEVGRIAMEPPPLRSTEGMGHPPKDGAVAEEAM